MWRRSVSEERQRNFKLHADLLADAAVLSCEILLASELVSSMLFQEGILFNKAPEKMSRTAPQREHSCERGLKKSVIMESNPKWGH